MVSQSLSAGTQIRMEAEAGISIVGRRNGLELAIKNRSERTLGSVIRTLQSAGLIADVILHPLQVFPDDRGFFAELARLGSAGIAEKMTPSSERHIQISTTLSYPGTIKAIHYHYEQTDLWASIGGMTQVILYDLRLESPTFGAINTLYVGQFQPWEILIPAGVAHGYKVIGSTPAQLVYFTDRYYNPEDEGRLPYDHPGIAYDWKTQHK
jgi:dTDP-4-dehydrorhamnose 3,5-epimerase